MSAADPFANMPNADDSWNTGFPPVISIPRAYDIIERTGQAEYYLREARRAGLPMPAYVTISARDFGDFQSSDIGIQLTSTDDVGQWALHFGADPVITSESAKAQLERPGQHHTVTVYHQFTIPDDTPGLAEHTAAACDTITKAAGQ